MLRRSLRLCQAALPISKTEFLDAFSRVHPEGIPDGRYKLGLAVSGGVDSMALAALCHEYLPRDKVELHGLIVDHRLRPTSSQEAQNTSDTLKTRLGMQTQILPITGVPRYEGHGIEGWARIQRFRALARGSRRLGVRNILLAHHEGDQYETILHRLSRHSRRHLGINSVTMCPYAMDYLADADEAIASAWKRPGDSGVDCFGVKGVVKLDILIRRPLLHFPKDRLVATSKALGLPWIEDETNQDRRLTPRNALRYVLATHKLPAALSKRTMIDLWSKATRPVSVSTARVADKLFELTEIKIDVRTGSAIVKMPTPDRIATELDDLATLSSNLTQESLILVIGHYLGRLGNLVDMYTGVRPPKTRNALFQNPVSLRKCFTHQDILYAPKPDNRWLLTIKKPSQRFLPKRSTAMIVEFPCELTNKWSDWQQFDLRWWLRVKHTSPTQIVHATYLNQGRLKRLRERIASGDLILKDISDSSSTSRNLEGILKSLGPEDLRWRLPVLTIRSRAEEERLSSLSWKERARRIFFAEDLDEDVLAFPTLGLRIHSERDGIAPSWIEELKWECWYKNVSWMGGRFEDSVYVPRSVEARGLVWSDKGRQLAKKEKGASSLAEWMR